MLKLFRDQRGFTLVELMIVVIIVGILAAVAIPMYRGSVNRAKASEAVAALGAIRSAERVYFAEHGTYYGTKDSTVTPDSTANVLDLTQADLTGRYFSWECYTFTVDADEDTFQVKCDGSKSTAPKASEVKSIIRYIDDEGNITK